VFTFPFDRFNRIPNKAIQGLAWAMLKPNPWWSIRIKGADLAKIDQPTIVIANHQSFMDLSLLYHLPWTMKWVAKKGLFKIPIFGWMIYMSGQISIDRKSMSSAKKLNTLVAPVKEGIPAMIFPEGTRSPDGELQAFKNGAFKLARKYNFNILPVVLKGGHEAMPPGSWRVSAKQEFAISVLNPINSGDYDSVADLKQEAYSLMNKELKSL
jgi:1-acyl-sn-glycerol-3-phosphate acyltransferase